ncbi:MAG: CRISPR-associated endoribonuclease Cas6 [Anaerovoracaceae bacterium]
MNIIAIKTKIYLLEDVSQENALEAIAAFVDKALCEDPKWEKEHKENKYKVYICSGLAPVEKFGVYKKDSLYNFTLRTLDMPLAKYLMDKLANTQTKIMKGIVNEVWPVLKKPIEKLYSLTPVIIKSETGKYWRGNMSLEDYQNRIRINLIKKYNQIVETKIDEDFDLWNLFEFKNQKPIATPYKNIKLLGDKVELRIADNQRAQDLAYMALATGLGEMGSRNFGYVNYHTVKGV